MSVVQLTSVASQQGLGLCR